jgi:ABC-type sugar transport system permease subunit
MAATSLALERSHAARRRAVARNVQGWLFVGPVVLGTLVFHILPMVPTVYASFTNWDGLNPPQWVGLANYDRALGGHDPNFTIGVTNTLLYLVGRVPGGILVGLLLALLVNERLRGITLVRAVFYLPVVSSVVAVGVVWRWIFNEQYGLLNTTLDLLNVAGPRWLTDQTWAKVAVVIVAIWHSMGYTMVLFLAGLQNIPPSLEEAAAIDGAGAWQRFRHVKLPLLTPTLFFVVIISIIGSFQVFNLIYVMTKGGPGTATYVYVYHMWQEGFQLHKFGYGSALAWMLFLVIAFVTFVQWKLQDRWVFYK